MTHLTRIQDHGDIFLFNKISCVTIAMVQKLSLFISKTLHNTQKVDATKLFSVGQKAKLLPKTQV